MPSPKSTDLAGAVLEFRESDADERDLRQRNGRVRLRDDLLVIFGASRCFRLWHRLPLALGSSVGVRKRREEIVEAAILLDHDDHVLDRGAARSAMMDCRQRARRSAGTAGAAAAGDRGPCKQGHADPRKPH